jgi:hypothetical protein
MKFLIIFYKSNQELVNIIFMIYILSKNWFYYVIVLRVISNISDIFFTRLEKTANSKNVKEFFKIIEENNSFIKININGS